MGEEGGPKSAKKSVIYFLNGPTVAVTMEVAKYQPFLG